MATARLAGLAPAAGLDAFVVGCVLFAVLGAGRQVVVGADSTIAPVLAAGAAAAAASGHPAAGLVALLTLLAGGMVVAAGLLRLGWVADLLSAPVITGVLAGVAVSIVIRQLPPVLGVPGGGSSNLSRLVHVVDQLGRVNGWAVGVAAMTLVVAAGLELVDRRIPGALVAVVLSILAVDVADLRGRGVAVIGALPGRLPGVALPTAPLGDVRRLLLPALVVTFLCIIQTAATDRQDPSRPPAPGQLDRDLVGVGAGSLAAALVGAPAVNASPPNSALMATGGSRSQLANLVAAAGVAAVALAGGGLVGRLPDATLGAVLIFVAARLVRWRQLRAVARFSRLEGGLAVVALLAVAVVGIEAGVVAAMVLSLADRTHRTARPRDTLLGREPGTDHWIPVDIGRPTEQAPGVVVYLLYGPLWYGNAEYVTTRVQALVAEASPPAKVLVLDADGMSDIDFTGVQALGLLIRRLEGHGVQVGVARASHLVHHDLKHGALLARLGDRLYDSVSAAVQGLT